MNFAAVAAAGIDFAIWLIVTATVVVMGNEWLPEIMERGWFPRAVSSSRRSAGRHLVRGLEATPHPSPPHLPPRSSA